MEMSMKQSIKNLEERTEPITILHTETFYCDGSEDEYDQHPRLHYTFNNRVDSTDEKMFERRGYVVCEYCYRKFKYEPEKKLLPLKDHYIPGVTENIPTYSEEMQDKLEPIPCPMHEDYDDPEPIDDYVNKILKGSG